MGQNYLHRTVLLDEAVQALNIRADGCYVDATFGRGGHSRRILESLNDQGCLLGIDRDPQAIEAARLLETADSRFRILPGSFGFARQLLQSQQLQKPVNGILLDLGVSSPQLDDAGRGFSFMSDGPLDMRMDTTKGLTAAQWLAQTKEEEIVRVLRVYGEERFARRIAHAIVAARDTVALTTTSQLADLVAKAIPRHEKHKHPATRTFQAIRIEINQELAELEMVLGDILQILEKGARLVVISFHSLEDRIVKQFIKKQTRGPQLPKGLPVQYQQTLGAMKAIGKAVFASAQEISENPRARSAVMRVAEVL